MLSQDSCSFGIVAYNLQRGTYLKFSQNYFHGYICIKASYLGDDEHEISQSGQSMHSIKGPYLDINMTNKDNPMLSKDAVFISTHKYLAGPGAPGTVINIFINP